MPGGRRRSLLSSAEDVELERVGHLIAAETDLLELELHRRRIVAELPAALAAGCLGGAPGAVDISGVVVEPLHAALEHAQARARSERERDGRGGGARARDGLRMMTFCFPSLALAFSRLCRSSAECITRRRID